MPKQVAKHIGEKEERRTFGEAKKQSEREESHAMQHSVLAAPSNYSYLGELLGTVTPIPSTNLLLLYRESTGRCLERREIDEQVRTREKDWRREDLESKGTVWISYVYTPKENLDRRT